MSIGCVCNDICSSGCVGPEETGKGWQQQHLINNSAHRTASIYTSVSVKLCVSLHVCRSAGLSRDVCGNALNVSVYKSSSCAISGTVCGPCVSVHVPQQGLCLSDESAFQERWQSDHKRFQDVHLALLSYDVRKSSPLIKLPGSQACVTLHRCLAQLLEHHNEVIRNQQGPT